MILYNQYVPASSPYDYKMRSLFCILKRFNQNPFHIARYQLPLTLPPPNVLQLFLRRSQDAACNLCTEGQVPTLSLPSGVYHSTSTAHDLLNIDKHLIQPSSATYCCCSQPHLREPRSFCPPPQQGQAKASAELPKMSTDSPLTKQSLVNSSLHQ